MHQDDESIAFPPIKWKTDKASRLLFVKGHDDKTTIANVTVAIKVMKSYYNTMPVFSAYGMPLVSAYLIKVIIVLLDWLDTFETDICFSLDFAIHFWFEWKFDKIWP